LAVLPLRVLFIALQHWAFKPLLFLWFNNRNGCDIVAGRSGLLFEQWFSNADLRAALQLPSIFCAVFSSLSVTDSISVRTDLCDSSQLIMSAKDTNSEVFSYF